MPDKSIVHIIDDDDAARQSLEFLLKSAKLDVRAHDSASSFLSALPKLNPGCVITDVRMPGLSGIEFLKKLKAMASSIPVIVITGHGDVPLAVEAMKNGAADFLEKPFDDALLLSAVRSALNRLEKDDKREAERAEILDKLAALSNRERQVLEGLVAGNANKIIAFNLTISPRTVEIYRANVMAKMAAASLSDLVRKALVAGILDNSTN
jgi:two-component system, LuxR family, response regulator FixJ